jgi:hypothetical protein
MTMTDVESNPFKWWAISDGGEQFTVGPCDSREEVIDAARQDFDGAAFEIVEAKFETPGYYIASRLHLDEALDLCFEGEGIFSDVSPEHWVDLERRIDAAVEEWAHANDIRPKVWAFGDIRNRESFDAVTTVLP